MYEISSESAKTLTDNSTAIRLPRFQRKQTWNEKKNFALCISIFNNYPIGMFVLNEEVIRTSKGSLNTSWLLDGRQRRNALLKIYENPENIYEWATKFIKFRKSDTDDEIENKFRSAIDVHLESDDSENTLLIEEDSPDINDDDFDDPNVGLEGFSVEEPVSAYNDQERIYSSNLDLLLEIIQMCHKFEDNYSGYSKFFDFSQYFVTIDYISHDSSGKKWINGIDLTTFITSYINQLEKDKIDDPTQEHFTSFLKKRYVTRSEIEQDNLERRISINWKKIKHRILIVKQLARQLHLIKVGIIKLTDCTSSDAQNIFKLINSSGTSLTAVEILSAKPSWNKLINNPSNDLENAVTKLYDTLDVKRQGIVKWDYPATLMDRLSNLNFIFPNFDYEKDSQFKTKVTLGFKLLAAVFEGGVTRDKISILSKSENVNWNEIDKVLEGLNTIGKLLTDSSVFQYLIDWKTTLYDLTSEAICLNFLVLVYKNWISKNSPIGPGIATTKFVNEANSLFDKMIYEYTLKQWRGSSDSKIAENIIKFNNGSMFNAINEDRWLELINELLESGTIQDEVAKQSDLTALIYYYYILKTKAAPLSKDKIDIDHIISKLHFKTATGIQVDMTNNISNLCLLESSLNKIKKDKSLGMINSLAKNDVKFKRLQDAILSSTDLEVHHLEEIETAANFNKLIELRKKLFIDAFTISRRKLLN